MKFVACILLLLGTPSYAFGTHSPFGVTRGTSFLSASLQTTAVAPENLSLLTERGRQALERLVAYDEDGSQQHVYADWPAAGTQDAEKQRLAEQVCVCWGWYRC